MNTLRPASFGALLVLVVACSSSETGSSSGEGGTANETGAAGKAAEAGGESGGASGSGTTNGTAGAPAAGGASAGTSGDSSAGNAGAAGGAVTAGGWNAGGADNGGGNSGGNAGTATNGGAGGTTVVSDCTTNSIAKCSGTTDISCHFGGNPGNYEVTVGLGGPAAGDMYVEAEMYRRILGETTTAAKATKSFSFVVNVRQPEGQPVENGPNDGTPGLDVYIRGVKPQLTSICFEPAKKPAMIWVAGDSTVCDQGGTDYSGWAQHLPQYFNVPVSVANYADSGESSGSFLNNAKMFGAIKAGWHAGDWLFVQLGHNDKSTTATTFQANMTSYVTQAKAAGVNVVLFTPISRVGYTLAQEHVNSTGANLPQIIRDLGKSQNVPVVDLTVTTWNWLQTIKWQDYFALGTDHTHLNPKGADVVAGFVRDAVKTQNLAIAPYLR